MIFKIIIPARYQSSRFPGKPLIPILGKPMIVRVWERCIKVLPPDNVYVATDDDRIFNCCKDRGINVLMTSENCLTGTDRVFEASKMVEADIIINVQGDEPLICEQDIQTVIDMAKEHPKSVINAMCQIKDERDFRSSTVPKVVARPDGRLLYMSRAAIPTDKVFGFHQAKKQVCIYAFPLKALSDFANVGSKTPLEAIEDIEILRFLELGFEVMMVEVSVSSVAVDIPDDLKRVEAILLNE